MLHTRSAQPVCSIEDLLDAEPKQAITGIIRNARFLQIGDGKCVLAGTIYSHRTARDGSTFYTEPLISDDGYIAATEDGHYAYSRSH